MSAPRISPERHFELCISRTRDAHLKQSLEDCLDLIEPSSIAYNQAGLDAEWFNLSQVNTWPVDKDELVSLYSRTMVAQSGPGRQVYDALLLSAENNICPLCDQRVVRTLDHYLPKQLYACFSILPNNLIPACTDCNRKKHEAAPTAPDKQYLHPYFDRLPRGRWLHAKITYFGPTPTFSFFVSCPKDWEDLMTKRLEYHFRNLGIGPLYSVQANTELSDIRSWLKSLFRTGSSIAVHRHLMDQWQSRAEVNENSWRAVTYLTLASEPEILRGNFG